MPNNTNNYILPTKPEIEGAYKALLATLSNKVGPYFSDYGQLIEKGSPLNNQYQQLKSNISQHIPSNADFRNPQAMSEWAQAAALNAPMGLALVNHGKLYRGLTNKHDPTIKNPVEWFSETPELAKIYGDNTITRQAGTADVADLGLRDYMTEVKKDNVLDRVKSAMFENFQAGKISKEKAIELNERLSKMKDVDNGYKRAHEFINTPEVSSILKDSGYDAISHIENGNQTFGFLNVDNKLPSTPFSKAHDIAQKNAALPIEQGGLGLPLNNTAMDRARAMGFDTPAYHGTTANIEQFDPARSSSAAAFGPGVYTTESAKDASGWLKSKDGGNVIPLLINESSFLKAREMDTKTKGILENFLGRELNDGPPPLFSLERRGGSVSEGAMNAGFGGVEHFGPSRTPTKNNVILDASKIRSRFAAFDPLKKDSANILATTLMGMLLGSQYNQEEQ